MASHRTYRSFKSYGTLEPHESQPPRIQDPLGMLAQHRNEFVERCKTRVARMPAHKACVDLLHDYGNLEKTIQVIEKHIADRAAGFLLVACNQFLPRQAAG